MSTKLLVGRSCLAAETVLAGISVDVVPMVTHPGAAGIAGRLADDIRASGARVEVYDVPDGDQAKTLAVAEGVLRWLADLDIRRDGVVVGVGGGAVTDLVGFTAGVYLRGVDAVYVPTTLLGAVDASIGGKTGVNLDGKNLAGVLKHPKRVIVDADVLDALPAHLKRQGLAEALKAGLIGDSELFEIIEAGRVDSDLEEVVRRALAVKQGIVERDFDERGERAHLNYGHTVGHAVETVLGLSHGEAVAVGMVAAGRASAMEAGFADEDRQRDAIAGLGLPTDAAGADAAEVLRLMGRDKKRDADGIRMVLLERIEQPRVTHVGAATVEAALAAVAITGGRT